MICRQQKKYHRSPKLHAICDVLLAIKGRFSFSYSSRLDDGICNFFCFNIHSTTATYHPLCVPKKKKMLRAFVHLCAAKLRVF
jgi:hypothetical protein